MGRSSTPPTPVPYDARVDYLETSGTQWIDTLYVPQRGESIEVEFFKGNTGANTQTLVSAGDGTNQLVMPFIKGNGVIYVRFFSDTGTSALNCTDLTWHKVFVDSTGVVSIDGVTRATASPTGDIDGTNKTLRLFYRSNNTNPMDGRIRSVKLVSGTTTVLDLIPVRIGQVGYMYDRVSGQLFGNAGTGDFILGQDV